MGTALYMRVSTEMQEEDGVSLETQDDTLNAYCNFKKFTDIEEYIDVGSARNTKRKDFQRLMKDIRRGRIKRVIILRLDRLTRSIVDLNKLLKILNRYGCELHSATENIDTATATGRMVMNLIATFAQWESETISERVTINMLTNARKGIWQGVTPYGYYLGDDKRLKIKEDEAKVLREAFDMIFEGNSFSSTEKYISKKYNLKWRDNFLRRKARTASLVGKIKRIDEVIDDTHEGIITEREQQQLIDRLEENRSGRTTNTDHKDLFRRKIECYQCGNNLALSTAYNTKNETHYYYRCNNCFKNGNGTITVGESRILESLKAYLDNIIIDDIESVKVDNKSPTAPLERRLKEVGNERDKIQRAWIKNLMSDDDLERYQQELDDEQEQIEKELSKLSKPIMTNEEYKQIVITLKSGFDNLSREDKRAFIQRFIKRIEFTRTLVPGYKQKYDIEITDVIFY